MYKLHHGDCLEVLKTIEANSVDAVVTDPPYGLKFMGKKWDHSVPSVEVWAECLRVLKPGGHLLCFAGTRTHHRMACNIEDAGFDIRDMIAWLYGSGFPKSHDISKAIDKAAGVEREKEWKRYTANTMAGAFDQRPWLDEARANGGRMIESGPPITNDAQHWQGWGTALKPALEPITMARKPFPGTVAQNVLQHGTGAINVDGCRVGTDGRPLIISHGEDFGSGDHVTAYGNGLSGSRAGGTTTLGRWPANLIHDGLQEEWARYFYCPKASKKDRDEGCEGIPKKQSHERKPEGRSVVESSKQTPRGNHHPTVKPTDLMAYLCRLICPPGGLVLDPFMGSGSTGKAAMLEGFQFVGIEREAEYLEIARARILDAIDTKGQKDG
jgi:DNA modification methylase